jgi:transcriptional regulator GlxA family with amidase domain
MQNDRLSMQSKHGGSPMARTPGLNQAQGLLPVRLRRVLDHIEAHLGESITQRRLAGIAQLSVDHFARLFRHSTGLPPHRYVLQRRIARARELVADRRLSLAEIGYELGFPSQAHFTAMFRRLVGTTPGAYRGVNCGAGGHGTRQRKSDIPDHSIGAKTKSVGCASRCGVLDSIREDA